MSAFIVDRAHIHALVAAGLRLPGPGSRLSWFRRPLAICYGELAAGGLEAFARERAELTHANADAVGQMLVTQNVRSVRYRYSDSSADDLPGPISNEWGSPYRFDTRALMWPISPLDALMSVDCYDYQSCEDPDWHRSEAAQFCDALRHVAIHALPGYDKANGWEYRAPELVARRTA